MTYHLYRWSLVVDVDPYKAPEQQLKYLVGFRDQDSRRVTTTAIVKVEGREVTTHTGSIYILEDIDHEYLRWLDSKGLEIDPNDPIKVRKVR